MRGIVLAGGLSSRMGKPKQWMEPTGRPLLIHTLEMMHTVCNDVVVVVREEADAKTLRRRSVPVVTDFYKGQGPLAGLHAGLQGTAMEEAVCLIGCDLPFMPEVLRDFYHMLQADPQLQAVVPSGEGHLYPVCAVYRGNVREVAAQCLEHNQNSMRRFLEQLRVAYVSTRKWKGITPSPFLNMNTPEDYEQACRLHKERSE